MNSQGDLGILKLLTENPEFMQKAMSIASSLASSGALSGLGLSGNDQPKESPSHNTQNAPDLSVLLGALGANTNQSAPKPPQIPEAKRDEHNEKSASHGASHRDRIKLLEAMRPFVPHEKREKLEFVIRLLGLIQVADQLGIKNMIEGR